MWFSPAERDPRRARVASSPLLGGRTSARPRPGVEGQRGCGPEPPRPCPLQDFTGEESRGPARPPGSQTVHCPRAAAAGRSHHNNMQSAARGRPPRRAHCTRLQVPGPGAHSKQDTGLPGPGLAGLSGGVLAGGLLQHCEMPATRVPQPGPLPALPSPRREGKSSSCPRGTAKGSVPEQCSAGHGEAPVPDAASLGRSSLLHFLRRRSPCG